MASCRSRRRPLQGDIAACFTISADGEMGDQAVSASGEDVPVISEVRSLNVALDESVVVAEVRLTDRSGANLPMTKAAAIKLMFLLNRVREMRGWQLPDELGAVVVVPPQNQRRIRRAGMHALDASAWQPEKVLARIQRARDVGASGTMIFASTYLDASQDRWDTLGTGPYAQPAVPPEMSWK